MLFIAAVFDVRSEMGDVPDEFAATAVIGGVLLHAAQSYLNGSAVPLIFCLSAGIVFSAYGWFAYWRGMWGGADALALSALGFGAPYMTLSLTGVVTHGFNLFFNLVFVAFIYTVAFSLVRAYRSKDFLQKFRNQVYSERKRVMLELGAGASVFFLIDFPQAAAIYGLVLVTVFLFRFLRVVEEHAMIEEVEVSELEGGEVIRESKSDKIKGVTGEEIEELEGKVRVMHGLRFMPVFPIALVLTDAGFTFLRFFIAF
jgi:hypothetical protein